MPQIAGTIQLDEVMQHLASERPVFHSEFDLRHAFAQVVHDLDPSVQIRLEVPQGGREHLDLRCFGARGGTALEFKYFTSPWQGTDPNTAEEFRLLDHGADDLARLYFVTDVVRLERFCRDDPTPTGSQSL